MNFDRIKSLSRFMDKKGLVELEVEEEGFKVKIKKGPAVFDKEVDLEETTPVGPKEESEEMSVSAELATFTSPMVGTFYRRPEEGAAPYIKIAKQVKEGDVLCHIQAMGIKSEIKSNVEGTIAEVLVEDGHPVEYGQPLFFIKPSKEKVDV